MKNGKNGQSRRERRINKNEKKLQPKKELEIKGEIRKKISNGLHDPVSLTFDLWALQSIPSGSQASSCIRARGRLARHLLASPPPPSPTPLPPPLYLPPPFRIPIHLPLLPYSSLPLPVPLPIAPYPPLPLPILPPLPPLPLIPTSSSPRNDTNYFIFPPTTSQLSSLAGPNQPA